MIRHAGAAEIGAPVSDVFTFVANVENFPQWQSEVVTSKVTSPGAMRTGTTFEEVVSVFGRKVPTRCEITEFQPTKRLGFKTISGTPIGYTGAISFEPHGRGTRITIMAEVTMRGLWRLVEPLFASEVRKGIDGELAVLKKLLEGPGE